MTKKEFWLAAQAAGPFYVYAGGRIRTKDGCCPIIAVESMESSRTLNMNAYEVGTFYLHLKSNFVTKIMRASDNLILNKRDKRARQKMLETLRFGDSNGDESLSNDT